VEVVPSVSVSIRRAVKLAGRADAICATGSLYLVGEILKKRIRRIEALFGLDRKE
jgi:folylpolyglutamate synthase/dihydropteroate synthase